MKIIIQDKIINTELIVEISEIKIEKGSYDEDERYISAYFIIKYLEGQLSKIIFDYFDFLSEKDTIIRKYEDVKIYQNKCIEAGKKAKEKCNQAREFVVKHWTNKLIDELPRFI